MVLDHILGRPSSNLQRIQVVVALACSYLVLTQKRDAPFPLRFLNTLLAPTQPWKIILGTLSGSYLIKKFFLLVYLNEPEPMARMYTRNFYRATWILTALDAGFLTAMSIKPAALRHLLSILFSGFYLLFADKADEKVRKYRAVATYQMMRVSWEKSSNPILRFVTAYDRGWLKIRKNITFKRPDKKSPSSFGNHYLGDIKARLYFSGSAEELLEATQLIFHIPGGGFVTMSPECHDDYVSSWARKTKIPIVSINYGKSPEHPYPWALEEVYDAYRSVVESNGQVIGFSGWKTEKGLKKKSIKIVVAGDSAGGNLTVGLVLKTLEHETVLAPVRTPCGVLLMYPCLTMDMACWVPQKEMSLLRAASVKSMTDLSCVLQAKDQSSYVSESPLATPEAPKRINILNDSVDRGDAGFSGWFAKNFRKERKVRSDIIRSSLSMTSRMSYFQDRLLAPELMRAMALLYLNGSPIPYNVTEDMYLSPAHTAPTEMLEKFPKVYFLTGEKDPLVDDTVVLAARIRSAKEHLANRGATFKPKRNYASAVSPLSSPAAPSSSKSKGGDIFDVRVKILEGFSHAFFNMVSILPEAKQAIQLTSDWYLELFGGDGAPGDDSLLHVHPHELMQRRRKDLASQHLEEQLEF